MTSLFICWACPFVFAFAAAIKLLDFGGFAVSLQSFELLDRRLAKLALVLVPIAECAPILLCIIGRFRAANIVCFLMLLVFTGVVSLHWRANIEPNCHCFGEWVSYRAAENRFIGYFVRNGVMLTASAAAVLSIGAGSHREPAASPYRSISDVG